MFEGVLERLLLKLFGEYVEVRQAQRRTARGGRGSYAEAALPR